MSVSLTLQNSINFIKPYLKNQPVAVTIMEPGLQAANLVLQILTKPPMKWRWNRRSFSFYTIASTPTTDYLVPLPDFGFMENIWLVDSTGKLFQLTGAISLAVDANSSRPTQIAPQYDDGLGNITFRLKNTPDAIYTVKGDYQRKPALLDSYAKCWDIVPDDFSHCYHLGYLTFLSLLVNDSRFPIFERWFLANILSAQDGLDDQARDIFMANWTQGLKTIQRSAAMTQSANTARGT